MRGAVYTIVPLVMASCASSPAPEVALHPFTPAKDEQTLESTARESSRFGIWADEKGFGLGYRKDRELRIPDICQIVFLVSSETQLRQARDLIVSELGDEGTSICTEEF